MNDKIKKGENFLKMVEENYEIIKLYLDGDYNINQIRDDIANSLLVETTPQEIVDAIELLKTALKVVEKND